MSTEAATTTTPSEPSPSARVPAQLRLFPAPQPLTDRLGVEFFRALPREPGVYRMFDAADGLIYVGKARDLRARLNSYRRTHGQSRKTIRLIHDVRRVEWEICLSDTDARLREAELIRTLRPRYNRAGTWPKSARYLVLETQDDGFRLRLTGEPEGESYGAFRGGVGFALTALGRLLALALRPGATVAELPRHWVLPETRRSCDVTEPGAAAWVHDVRDFFAGANDALVARLLAAVTPEPTSFGQQFVAQQFAVLEEFYRRGPCVNRRLHEEFPGTGLRLAPEERDDLLIRAPQRPAAAKLTTDEAAGNYTFGNSSPNDAS